MNPRALAAINLDLLKAVDRSRSASESGEAWRRWNQTVDLDAVDAGAFELLPRLQRRLEEIDPSSPKDPRITGVYRYSWSKNQLLLSAAAELAGDLRQAGIRTTAISGTWIGFDGTSDHGGRPLRSADLAITAGDAHLALAALTESGWAVSWPGGESALGSTSGVQLSHVREQHLPVCLWYRLPVQIIGMRRLIGRSSIAEKDDRSVATPSADDRLIELCLEGMCGAPHRRLGWIADAAELTVKVPVDWQELVRTARVRRISAHLAAALAHLTEVGSGEVPKAVVQELSAMSAPVFERNAMRMRARDSGIMRALALGWDQHRRYRILGSEDPLERPPLRSSMRERHSYVNCGA